MVEIDELKVELMQADIENKHADTAYKHGLLRYEPWKVIATTAGATAAVTLALLALATFILSTLQHH